ncbi:hypothetical protein PO878_03995 [Iamia majanohamensis]|uniref:Uncharacterized protein n=1 Tax=Iamia majanohamensis TaxID=467976 RepID=A0AAF0BWJ0_9ACTN|nr:hypothetical protein [Iamia majanohamensis]WCO67885.1 hypothetical protein PO878_03995 [Iamia majanohamensis]
MSLLDVAQSAPPRYKYLPPFFSSAGRDALDLGEAAGVFLDDWQQDVVEGLLAEDEHGKWAATEAGIICTRQNGKDEILLVRELFGLYLDKGCRLLTHTAHRFDTCLDHFRRMRDVIEGCPDLLAEVKDNGRGVGGPSGIKDSNGAESIELRDGTRQNFKARGKGSGRGFSGDVVVLNEAFWLLELGSLVPSMSARPNPQLILASSAPLPRPESDRLRSLIRRGRALAETA